MNTPLSSAAKMLLVSIAFCLLLVGVRMYYTGSIMYGFYIWNMVLAVMPLIFSRQLVHRRPLHWRSLLLLGGWLVFFPNAPYLVTDILHFTSASSAPRWFDLVLVTTAAWNGLLLGALSLMHIEGFLALHFSKPAVSGILLFIMVLCGYGVYLGRFLRFNSWDVLTDPYALFSIVGQHWLQPAAHVTVWAFTLLFAGMFAIFYFTLKYLKQ
ncbi:DUF1361 domain-containing protein [Chitinophaga alhagiae]|uniref:DUF1361 domain-containing protein n=1 Tax=Chitinophaga alhagiae TaxID=2203219 RepID=UPI000E5C34A6|nr:DUF1361 domain-containing protein [Chitinophaga alhagiae]